METLNDRIKTLRKEKGLTQSQLAHLLGITDKAISKWEVGEANPDIELLPKIASIFEVTVDYLLTGTVQEKEMVIISPKEMLLKTDDPKYLEQIASRDLDLQEIFDNKLTRVFAYLVDNKTITHYPYMGSSYSAQYMEKMLLFLLLTNRLDKIDVFGMRDIGYMSEEYWTGEVLTAFVSDPSVTDETREYVLSTHQRKLKDERTSSSNSLSHTELYTNGNWQKIYPNLLLRFAKAEKWDWVSKILTIFSGVNYPSLERLKDLRAKGHTGYFLSFSSGDNHNWGLRALAIPKKVLDILLESKQYELFERANSMNAALERVTIGKKTVYLSKVKNDETLSETERFEKLCVYQHIINVDLLSSCRDPKLVRKILDENYLHYYEYIYDLITHGRVKEAFEFLVDNDFDCGLGYFLPNGGLTRYSKVLSNCFSIFTSKTERMGQSDRAQLLAGQMRIDDRRICQFSGSAGLLENNPIIIFLQQEKNAIYQRVLDAIERENTERKEKAEMERIAKSLPREYFDSLLLEGKKDNIELFVIKLCALLDAIFLYDYHYEGEDFSARLNAHFHALEENAPKDRLTDEKERIVSLKELFYRLRTTRNNIAHPGKAKIQGLSQGELQQCLDYVFGLMKEENEQ